MRLRRFATVLLLLLTLPVASSAVAVSLDSQIAAQKKTLATLDKRVKYHNRELAKVKRREKSYLQELNRYDMKAKRSEESLRLLNLQIQKNENEKQALQKKIDNQNKRIAELRHILAERCIAVYKYGSASSANALLSSADTAELSNIVYLMKLMTEEDSRNITELENTLLALKAEELKLTQVNDRLASRRRDSDREMKENRAAGSERRKLLAEIGRKKKVHASAVRELEEDQRAVQKKINAFISRRAAQRRKSGQSTVRYKHSGKFKWPVPDRRITSKYGMRVHPKFKTRSMHTGIDIASRSGTPIKAAANGEVIFAGWLRGYGQVVIIDHGSNYSTVYAHMSAILVEEGAHVTTSTVIGRVGMTGVATGPHLHFEVRVNGTAKNPVKYL